MCVNYIYFSMLMMARTNDRSENNKKFLDIIARCFWKKLRIWNGGSCLYFFMRCKFIFLNIIFTCGVARLGDFRLGATAGTRPRSNNLWPNTQINCDVTTAREYLKFERDPITGGGVDYHVTAKYSYFDRSDSRACITIGYHKLGIFYFNVNFENNEN